VSADSHSQALLDEVAELYAIVLRITSQAGDGAAMTATQRLALIEVAAIGPLRLHALAACMQTTPATASRAVDALEQLELVERRADADDGRAVQIAATARDRRWSEKRRDLVLGTLAELSADVTPPLLTEQLARLNAALRDVMGQEDLSRGALLAH
jgi:DNA-binding MarR family transcriptional regulator